MNIVPVSYNGVNINDGTNYSSFFPQGQSIALQADSDAVLIERPFLTPIYAVKKLGSKTVPLAVVMRGNIATQLDSLKLLFNTQDQNLHDLVIADANDSSKQWTVQATCVAQKEITGAVTTFTMVIPDPVWYSVIENNSSWSVTSTGSTKTVTVAGNYNAQPILELTPTTASTGSTYKRWFMIRNISSSPWVNFPLNIMGTGFDTAALVTAGKMLASGNDLQVLINSTSKPRTLGAMNTTNTRVWVNVNAPAKFADGVISSAITASGNQTIYFDVVSPTQTAVNNKEFLTGIKNAYEDGYILIDSEYLWVESADPISGTLSIIKRGACGSTAASHSIGATAYYYGVVGYISYGNASAGAPASNAATTPIFNTDTSTNTQWNYSIYGSLANPGRSGAWSPSVIYSQNKTSATYTQAATTYNKPAAVDPYTTAGLRAQDGASGATILPEKATLAWTLSHPLGISSVVSASVRKYAYNLSLWPAGTTAALQNSTDGINFVNAWSDAPPTVANTFQTSTYSSISLSAISNTVRFYLDITQPKITASVIAQTTSMYELTTISLGIGATYQPTMAYSAELARTPINCKITNTTTGEWIAVSGLLIETGSTLKIDTVNRLISLDGSGNYNRALYWSSTRAQWLDLLPAQNNTLKYEQVGTGNVTIAVKWRDRKL